MENAPRIIDIARKVGVSVSTVGLVLNNAGSKSRRVGEKTAARISEVAEQLRYVPNLAAQQLKGSGSLMLGVLMDSRPLEHNSIRLSEINNQARKLGYHLVILHGEPDGKLIRNCIKEFAGRRIDGLICMTHAYPQSSTMIPGLVLSNIQNVVFIDEPAIEGTVYVGADYAAGNRLATEYLIDCERKRIGLALSDLSWYSNPRRKEGYIQGLLNKGRSIDENLIWVGAQDVDSDLVHLDPVLANQIIDQLVVAQKADAILTCDDYWALQLLNCLRGRGYRVPDDVALVGNGNWYIAGYTDPTLTTVDFQLQRVSQAATDLLVKLINKSITFESKQLMVEPNLIVRKSA